MKNSYKKAFLLFMMLFLLPCLFVKAASPSALYLTWIHDPTTTMTIQWHTPLSDPSSMIYYKEKGQTDWKEAQGKSVPLYSYPILVHTLELIDLNPDTDYQFRIGKEKDEYLFRTLANKPTRDLKFAIGGDAYLQLHLLKKMNRQIAKASPDFVVLGGDIAYTVGQFNPLKGHNWELKRWQTFFREWKHAMVTPEGRLIPLLIVLGNHDIQIKTSKNPKKEAKIIYTLFAFPEKETPFRTLDVGDYLSLFLLDTGHHYKIGGPQTTWLQKALEKRQNVTFKSAVYHVAAYPSKYEYSGRTPTLIRENWVPLFEKYLVQTAFENHNHTFKRTHKIKNGAIDTEGVIYLGDGSWGVIPRTPLPPSKLWYLEKSSSTNAFWLTTLNGKKATLTAIDINGKVIDTLEVLP